MLRKALIGLAQKCLVPHGFAWQAKLCLDWQGSVQIGKAMCGRLGKERQGWVERGYVRLCLAGMVENCSAERRPARLVMFG